MKHPIENKYEGELIVPSSSFVHPTAYVRPGTIIGEGVAIMECAIIGGRGFTLNVFDDENNWRKVGELRWRRKEEDYPVVLGDDVYIGANTIIQRGTKWNTQIKKGTMISSDIHIGHDSIIGEHCLILTKTILCGSSEIGDFVRINPSCTIHNGKSIGKGATIGIGSLVMDDVPDYCTFVGRPAVNIDIYRRFRKKLKELLS